ncbi:hypothetical protein ACFPAF_05630 [Hymenobacter endophyticus]
MSFPLIYSAVFQLGFYNFCLSLVLLMTVLGYWRRHFYRRVVGAHYVVGLAVLFVLLYFAHPLTYLLAGLVLGVFLLGASWGGHPKLAANRQMATFRTGFLPLLLACLPSLLLLGWWLLQPAAEQQLSLPPPGIGQLLHDWLLLEPLRFMGSVEGTYRLLLAALLFGLVAYVVWQHWQRKVAGGMVWGGIIGMLLLGYVFLPDALLGGSIIRPRLGLLSYLFVLGLLGAGHYPVWLRHAVVCATVVVAVLLLSFRFTKYRTWATGLVEYQAAAPYLRPGTSVVSFTYGPALRMPNGKEYRSYIDVFSHAASYLSVDRQLLDLENYEAHTGYFPLVWRPGQELVLEQATHPARAHWSVYPHPQWPKYIVVWARSEHPQPSAQAQELTTHLRHNYRLVFISQTGLLELYEYKLGSGFSNSR